MTGIPFAQYAGSTKIIALTIRFTIRCVISISATPSVT
jgi:hypothetical protein